MKNGYIELKSTEKKEKTIRRKARVRARGNKQKHSDMDFYMPNSRKEKKNGQQWNQIVSQTRKSIVEYLHKNTNILRQAITAKSPIEVNDIMRENLIETLML